MRPNILLKNDEWLHPHYTLGEYDFHACKSISSFQPRSAIFRRFLCNLRNLLCFIAVYIRGGQDVWKPAVSTGIFFSLLFFCFFLLLFPLPDFFSISPLYHQNLKYASKQSCLCNWPLNGPGRLFSSRPFFTDKCIQTLTSVNMHWFVPGDASRRTHIF